MQFKTLFVLATSVAFTLATSTVQDVLNNVSKIDASVNALVVGLHSFPQTGGTTNQAIEVHNHVGAIIDAVHETIETAKDVSLPVATSDGTAVLDAFHTMVPLIQAGIATVIDKKVVLGALGVGRAHAIIHLDLTLLKQAVVSLEVSLLAITPAECVDEAKGLSLSVKVALDAAIGAFA